MEYIYLGEQNINKNISINDVSKDIKNGGKYDILFLLCYSVNNESKYPFLQFMMDKMPYCDNLIKEQFSLPHIFYTDFSKTIETLVLEKVIYSLNSIGCNSSKIQPEMYKGVFFDIIEQPYALIDITGIDISGMCLTRNSLVWFALPSEIINFKHICNIDIDLEATNLFTNSPKLGVLINPLTNKPYINPDAVYTGGEIKMVEFNSTFGINKSKIYNRCGEYYYFFRSFTDAVKYGGWIKEGGTQTIDPQTNTYSTTGRLLIDNEYGKYVTGGINRFALFIEGNFHIETESEFMLTDLEIEQMYPEPCVIICYFGLHNYNPDVLVKNNISFVPLTYHKLNNEALGDNFIPEKKSQYMIL
jgi:hypothetical protein